MTNKEHQMNNPFSNVRGKIAVAVGLLAFSCAAFAAPAPWFYWKSVVTGERVCSQFTPGDGWVQENTPYKDARCASRF